MIYLHVGTPKTGTTTIQSSLIANQSSLLQKEYLYPQAGILHWGHHNIYYDLAKDPEKYKPSLGSFELLLKNINIFKERTPTGNVILSSETFSGAYEGLLARLIHALQKIDVVIPIIYLREQSSYLFSFWSMLVYQNKTNYKFEKWAMHHIEIDRYGGNYLICLERLDRVVGSSSTKIVVYEEVRRKELFSNFLLQCDIKADEQIIQPKDEYNKSEVQNLKHLVNSEKVRILCKERYTAVSYTHLTLPTILLV